MDVPEDDEGKPPASFIGEGIPPAPRSEPHRASRSAAAVEPVVPKGELELYEGFSDLSAMRAGRRGPRSLHLRTQDLVDLPVDELSDKYVQAMKHVQVMASMLTGIHNVDELPVAGNYRLVSEADWDRRCRSQKKAKRKVRTLRAQLGQDLDEDQFSTTSSSDSMASEGTRAADRERRKKKSKAKRQRLAAEQAMKDEAQQEKIQELQRKLEELEKERAAVPAAGGAEHAATTDVAPEVAAPVVAAPVALEEAVGEAEAAAAPVGHGEAPEMHQDPAVAGETQEEPTPQLFQGADVGEEEPFHTVCHGSGSGATHILSADTGEVALTVVGDTDSCLRIRQGIRLCCSEVTSSCLRLRSRIRRIASGSFPGYG